MTDFAAEVGGVVSALLAERCPTSRLSELVAQDVRHDRALFDELVDMGVTRLAVSEECGGHGGDLLTLVEVFERLGAALTPVAVHSTCAVLGVLEWCSAESARAVIDSALPATLALSEGSAWDDEPATLASTANGALTVTGSKQFVLDADVANAYLVSAELDGDFALVLLWADADGIQVAPHESLDLTRSVATVAFVQSPATLIASGATARAALNAGLDRAAVLLAAEQTGGAQACLDMACEYALVREQFGQPIGSFQAIKHRLADMFTRVSGARALVRAAADAGDEGDVATLASASKSYCSDAYVYCAQENIQVHGGIGFTWEHVAHLYLRRARSTEVVYGSPVQHRERLTTLSHSHLISRSPS